MLGLGLLAVTVMVIAVVAWPDDRPPSASEAQEPIDGYPQRIGFDRPSPRLPDRPGPLAATLYDNDFGNGRQLGVSPRGRLWELPAGINVLSPDGRFLLTGQGDGQLNQLVVHDLSTGDKRVLDDIGQSIDMEEPAATRYVLDPSGAVLWSPDGSAVLGSFAERGQRGRPRPAVLELASGDLTEVGGGEPAGFRSPSEVVTIRKLGDNSAEGGIVTTTTDLMSGDTSSLPLQLAGPWRGDPDGPLEASVSPDGTTLLLIEVAKGEFPDATLRLFSLTDGSELAPRSIHHWDSCSPAWLGNDPVLPTETRGRGGSLAAGSELVTADASRPLVAVHYRLQSSCLQPTADALEAGPHRALFGTRTGLWTWYWWQLLLAGSLALAVPGVLIWRRRRSRSTGESRS